jgi:hypothetical protein
MSNISKLRTFESLLSKATAAFEDTDDFELDPDNKNSVAAFDNLQEMYSLRAIALINYIINNSETLIEEFIFDLTE